MKIMITITLNGEPRQVAPGNILTLLEELALPGTKIAVERNLEIVPKSLFGETAILDGDRIEIVQFVGGG